MPTVPPLLILAIGVAVVLGMIVVLRLNAFLALITAAIIVSLLAPGETALKISRVAEAFGKTVGNIGLVIALAAIIGKCMLDSGAADCVVNKFLSVFGEKRQGSALAASGFVLSIPVFFDTVFYLLVPLARSAYRRKPANYLKMLLAIGAGGAVTHTLIPPTPGPMLIADALQVDLGMMILMGCAVGLPMTMAGLAFATWIDRRMPIEMRPTGLGGEPLSAEQDQSMPGLTLSLLPVVLPVVLIATNTIVSTMAKNASADSSLPQIAQWTSVLGNPNLALMFSAAIALGVYIRQRCPSREQTAHAIEQALMSSGVVILITAAGGAFGGMLQQAQIGTAIEQYFSAGDETTGFKLLLISFGLASLLKISQGSGTIAMITASGVVAGMMTPETVLGFHRVYLAMAIGNGAMVGSWMNDSGFWIYSKMGGVTETEALKTWTPLIAILGITGMLATLLLAWLLPLAGEIPINSTGP